MTAINSPSVAGYFHPEGGALVDSGDEVPSDIDVCADVDVFDSMCDDDDDDDGYLSPVSPTPPTYCVGDNVLAKWKRNHMYLAHVTSAKMTGGGPVYDVYFPGDGAVKLGLSESDLCEYTSSTPKRGEMIGRVFYCPGGGPEEFSPGDWKVRRMEGNTYHCVRLSGSGVNLEVFDIGYVIHQWIHGNEVERERGPR